MVHRRRSLVLLVAGAALVLGPLVGAPTEVAAQSQGQNDDIVWANMTGIAIGDFWTYRVSGDEEGEVRNEVIGAERFKGFWEIPYDTFKLHAEGELTSEGNLGPVEVQVDATKWARRSDYGVVELRGSGSVQGTEAKRVMEAYNPPLVELVFPFTQGYEWNARSYWRQHDIDHGETFSTGIEGYIDLRAKVHGLETITVPAGTFEAWKIEYISYRDTTNIIMRWWAPEVCEIVKEQRYDDSRALRTTMELVGFSCSALTVRQPTYDPGNVTLLSRGVAGGSTGNPAPPRADPPTTVPGPDGSTNGDGPETEDAGMSAWMWPAVVAVALAAILLVWVGRRRLA